MSIISPEEFELKYRKFEQRISSTLAERINPLVLFIIAAATLGFILFSNHLLTNGFRYIYGGGLVIMLNVRYGILAVIALSLVYLMIPRRAQGFFQVISFFVIWTTTVHALFSDIPHIWTYALTEFCLPFFCLAGWTFLKIVKRTEYKRRTVLIFSVAFWAYFINLFYFLNQEHEGYSAIIVRLKLYLIWITFLTFAFNSKTKDQDLVFSFNPFNALRGVLWPHDFKKSEARKNEIRTLWWLGIMNLILGYTVLNVRLWLERSGLPHDSHSILARSASYYCFAILADVGALNIITGAVRLFGYKVRDATNFVFLARTPADFWRRGSVYNYMFVLQYVFIPVFRVLRNSFLATFFAFLFFFFNHYGFDKTSQLILTLGRRPVWLEIDFMHFLGWFFLLFVSRRIWFFPSRKREEPWCAWASIALTHLCYILMDYGIEAAYSHFGGVNPL